MTSTVELKLTQVMPGKKVFVDQVNHYDTNGEIHIGYTQELKLNEPINLVVYDGRDIQIREVPV